MPLPLRKSARETITLHLVADNYNNQKILFLRTISSSSQLENPRLTTCHKTRSSMPEEEWYGIIEFTVPLDTV